MTTNTGDVTKIALTRYKCATVVLVLTVAWLSAALVKAENQRYALSLGMCIDERKVVDYTCLKGLETRTAWYWHLFYGLIS
jgi:hypothetical protein